MMAMFAYFRALFVCLALLVAPGLAHAGYIQLTGSPAIQVTFENGEIRLNGKFPITNNGNEQALNVYPTISIGSYAWAGKPRPMGVGESFEWSLEAVIKADEMGCEKDPLCAQQQLPLTGSLPLLSRLHYQDLNSYPFSASQVYRIDIGERSNKPPSTSIQGKLMFSGDGEKFEGRLSVQNSSTRPRRVSVSLFSSREILVKTSPFVLETPPQDVASAVVNVENFTGTHGSMYPIYAILQWEEDGLRETEHVFGHLTLSRPNKKTPLIIGLSVTVIFSLALLWFLVIRRGKNAK